MSADPPSKVELLGFINQTPILLSLLYDLDMMPEQCPDGSRKRDDMFCIAAHFKAAIDA